MNSFEMYISDMYWDSLLIGDVKIIIAHTLARALKSDWMIFVCTYLSLFNKAFGMKFESQVYAAKIYKGDYYCGKM